MQQRPERRGLWLPFCRADGEVTNTMAGLFGRNHDASSRRQDRFREDRAKSSNYVRRSCVPKTKNDNLNRACFGGGSNLAEIQVERLEDSTLRYGLLEDLSVRQSVKPLVS